MLSLAPTKFTDSIAVAGASENITNGLVARRSVTTHSSRIPVPATPFHIVDRMVARMGSYNELEIRKMLPPEVVRGGKMDLNRLWGNNADSGTANTVVDDLAELQAPETIFSDVYTTPPTGEWLASNPQYDPTTDATTRRFGRHLYARHLFVMLMLLMDERGGGDARIDYRVPQSEGLVDGDILYQLTARRLAQWAVNCVDFRDPDAIMTAFEYDPNPFDGWSVDGDPLTVESSDLNVRDVVWGCEFPDALLTESVGFHDRRVRDTAFDSGPNGSEDPPPDPAVEPSSRRIHASHGTDPMKEGDSDLDQVRKPEGSTFLEIYCARQHSTDANDAANPVLPRELYDAAGRLDLARMDAQTSTFPVWRVAISVSHHTKGAGATSGRDEPAQSPHLRARYDHFPAGEDVGDQYHRRAGH